MYHRHAPKLPTPAYYCINVWTIGVCIVHSALCVVVLDTRGQANTITSTNPCCAGTGTTVPVLVPIYGCVYIIGVLNSCLLKQAVVNSCLKQLFSSNYTICIIEFNVRVKVLRLWG